MDMLNWPESRGWLVLSGMPDALSDIRALALTKIYAEGGVAYIGLDDDDYDDLMDDMGELGAPTGYLVNIMTEDDVTIKDRLEHAAMVFLPDEYPPEALHAALRGIALEGIKAAYERGAVIMAEGASIGLFGMLFMADEIAREGFNWLEDSLIVPNVSSITQSDMAQKLLATDSVKMAVGVGAGSAMVLGPAQQIETWGAREVTLVFGSLPDAE